MEFLRGERRPADYANKWSKGIARGDTCVSLEACYGRLMQTVRVDIHGVYVLRYLRREEGFSCASRFAGSPLLSVNSGPVDFGVSPKSIIKRWEYSPREENKRPFSVSLFLMDAIPKISMKRG